MINKDIYVLSIELKYSFNYLVLIFISLLRLVMKIWLKIRNMKDDFIEEQEKLSNSWNNLMSHYEDLVCDSKDLLTAQYKILEAHLNKKDLPSMEEFITIYGKILTNSFSLRSDRFVNL